MLLSVVLLISACLMIFSFYCEYKYLKPFVSPTLLICVSIVLYFICISLMDCSEAWLIYSAFTTLGITLLKGISDFCIFINLRFDVPYIFADNTETEEYVKTDIEILNMMYEDDKILIVKNILRNTEMDDFEKRKAYLDFSTKMRNRVLN